MLKNKKGMTMLELVIVLALMGILAGIIVPNFIKISDRTKLKSDIQSIKLIQNAIEVYNAENKTQILLSDDGIKNQDLENLVDAGYIKNYELQTENVKISVLNSKLVLDISACNEKVKSACKGLSKTEAESIKPLASAMDAAVR